MLSLMVWDHTWLKVMVRDKNERFRGIRFVLSGVFLSSLSAVLAASLLPTLHSSNVSSIAYEL